MYNRDQGNFIFNSGYELFMKSSHPYIRDLLFISNPCKDISRNYSYLSNHTKQVITTLMCLYKWDFDKNEPFIKGSPFCDLPLEILLLVIGHM